MSVNQQPNAAGNQRPTVQRIAKLEEMIRYCGKCGLITSEDGRSVCKACGGTLLETSDLEGISRDDPARFATSCCPNPQCKILVVLPAKKFCAECGSQLQPPSYELWVEKFVKPALENNPAKVMLEAAALLRPASEMGLSRGQAREHLDLLLEERTSVKHEVLARWIQETETNLSKRRRRLEAAKGDAIRQAVQLGIPSADATAVVERLSLNLTASSEDTHIRSPLTQAADGSQAAEGAKPVNSAQAHKRTANVYTLRRKRAASDLYYQDLLEDGAQSLYRNLVHATNASDVPARVEESTGDRSGGVIQSSEICVVEAGGCESTFVLFSDSSGHSWFLSNPQQREAGVSFYAFFRRPPEFENWD